MVPTERVLQPIAFITQVALLDQACAQCPISPTAAPKPGLDLFSVPVWPAVLPDRLGVVGLVGRYPTNYLIPRRLPGTAEKSLAVANRTEPNISPFYAPVRRSGKNLRSTCMC